MARFFDPIIARWTSGDPLAESREGGFNLNPTFSKNRTDLRLHPDGNKEVTLGCIGPEGNASSLPNSRDTL